MDPINQQILGLMAYRPDTLNGHKDAYPDWMNGSLVSLEPDGSIGYHVAAIEDADNPQATARLFAAAYNAFNKAGCELGLDAAALATETDVAALIRFRTSVLAAMVKLSDSPKSFMSQIGNLIDDTEGCAPLLRG